MFVVTGGSSGLGMALAYALADRGQKVLIIGRNENNLLKAADYSSNINFLSADVTSVAERLKIVNYLHDIKSLQGLIHNAGIINPIAPLGNISEKDWRLCMTTNLDAPLFLSQALMSKLKNGRVLHIGSNAAYFPVVGWTAYCVSKAALSMLTKSWQLESNSIAVASVMPGIIDTDMQREIRDSQYMDAQKKEFFHRLKKENKLLQPEVVATFLTWLLLDIDKDVFISREWDIYEPSHHSEWLLSSQTVPDIN